MIYSLYYYILEKINRLKNTFKLHYRTYESPFGDDIFSRSSSPMNIC